jgi:hypothetical protein
MSVEGFLLRGHDTTGPDTDPVEHFHDAPVTSS